MESSPLPSFSSNSLIDPHSVAIANSCSPIHPDGVTVISCFFLASPYLRVPRPFWRLASEFLCFPRFEVACMMPNLISLLIQVLLSLILGNVNFVISWIRGNSKAKARLPRFYFKNKTPPQVVQRRVKLKNTQ